MHRSLKHPITKYFLMMLLFVGGCKSTEQPEKRSQSQVGSDTLQTDDAAQMEHHISSNDKTYRVAFTPKPSPIPMNEPFTLDVVVLGEAEAGIGKNLKLDVDAAMPEHQHGMNTRPRVQTSGDGRFLVEGMLFHMPGHWELYFDITDGAVSERAQFDINLE